MYHLTYRYTNTLTPFSRSSPFSSVGGGLRTLSGHVLVIPCLSEDSEGASVLFLLSNLASLLFDSRLNDRKNGFEGILVNSLGSLDLLGIGVTGLGLASLGTLLVVVVFERVHDKLRFVKLKTVDVSLETFLGTVLTAVINGDTDGHGFPLGDASSLQLSKSESTSSTDLEVVFDSLTVDDRTKLADRTRSELSGPGFTSLAAGDLLGGLVEPCFDEPLPVLAEVPIGHHVVVFHHP
mmetsp:Transcript_20653/g.38855  ORF Transcript_20653/g.38855 Transcript_20653/m.38855 type:complete len:237 (-) Transcript_20653:23-733(-)